MGASASQELRVRQRPRRKRPSSKSTLRAITQASSDVVKRLDEPWILAGGVKGNGGRKRHNRDAECGDKGGTCTDEEAGCRRVSSRSLLQLPGQYGDEYQ